MAICAGALLGVFGWTAMSDTRSVVAVRAGIERGAVIDEADLMSVQVGVDPALSPVRVPAKWRIWWGSGPRWTWPRGPW